MHYSRLPLVKFTLLLSVVLLSGCFQKSESEQKKKLAQNYWESIVKNDPIETSKHTTLTVNQSSAGAKIATPKILRVSDDGVIVGFSRYCYDDFEVTTFVTKSNGLFKVNHKKTVLGLFKTMMKLKTNKPLCYPFTSKPLEIKTQEFEPENLILTQIDFLGKTQHKIISRDCKVDIKCPSILLFNLRGKHTQGNLNDEVRATLYIPPSENIIGVGSFKLSNVDPQTKRLDLVFKDESNKDIDFRGYITFDASELAEL